jgi:hypothetical protein
VSASLTLTKDLLKVKKCWFQPVGVTPELRDLNHLQFTVTFKIFLQLGTMDSQIIMNISETDLSSKKILLLNYYMLMQVLGTLK